LRNGIKKGAKEKTIDIIKSMKRKNFAISDIIEITGMSQKEAEAIKV